MTPTLEDVSCLLGLRIDGNPVIGISDDDWSGEIENLFGDTEWETFRRPPGTYHLSMVWLRRPWVRRNQPVQEENVDGDDLDEDVGGRTREPYQRAYLSNNADENEIRRYARGFILDLLYNVTFPDNSGYVNSFYAQFITDIDEPSRWSWGSALLAHTYRGLCTMSEKSTNGLLVSRLFLQLWIWTRFPIGKPQVLEFHGPLHGMAFGIRWSKEHHVYVDCARGSISSYRRQFEELSEKEVNWEPYKDFMDQLPAICCNQREQRL